MKKSLFLLLSFFITNKTLCSQTEIYTMGGQRVPSPTKFEQYRVSPATPTQDSESRYFFAGRKLAGAEAGAAAAIFNKKK